MESWWHWPWRFLLHVPPSYWPVDGSLCYNTALCCQQKRSAGTDRCSQMPRPIPHLHGRVMCRYTDLQIQKINMYIDLTYIREKSLVLEPGTSKISIRTSINFHAMSGGRVNKYSAKLYLLKCLVLFCNRTSNNFGVLGWRTSENLTIFLPLYMLWMPVFTSWQVLYLHLFSSVLIIYHCNI